MSHKHTLLSIAILLQLIAPTMVQAIETDYVPGVILVKTTATPSGRFGTASSPLEGLSGVKILTTLPIPKPSTGWTSQSKASESKTYVIEVAPDQIDATITTLSKTPGIESAEKDYYVYISDSPNDPKFSMQTYLNQTTLQALLDIPVTSETIVAVLDTGVDTDHSELLGQITNNHDEIKDNKDNDQNELIDDISGYSFYGYSINKGGSNNMDYHSHGTHISGIIGAKSNNRSGICGINPNAKILNAKFLDSNGRGSQSDAAVAIYYAVAQGAKVINCSWGYTQISSVLRDAVIYAQAQDVIIVAASGNDNHSIMDYPSGFDEVVTVGSIDLSNRRSYFSNYGPHLDIATYGENIESLGLSNTYTTKSGTSQSAAVISGIISLIYSVNPALTSAQALDILYQSCDDIGPSGKDVYTGYGAVNGNKLKALLLNTEPSTSPSVTQDAADTLTISNLLNFPNPISTTTQFGFDSNKSGTATIKIYTLTGRLIKEIETSFSDTYNTQSWDTTDDGGHRVMNGNYIYSIEFKSDSETVRKKGLLTIVRN